MAPEASKPASAPDMARGEAIEIVMGVARDPASGLWRVEADDGSILEADFRTAASAARWIADRADLDDREARSTIMRASPAQRRAMRRLLDEIEGTSP
jgi:hypothetical protein